MFTSLFFYNSFIFSSTSFLKIESRRDFIKSRRGVIKSRRDLLKSRRDLLKSRRDFLFMFDVSFSFAHFPYYQVGKQKIIIEESR